MNVTISPRRLRGTVEAIPSKSEAHRLLICAALADAPTEVIIPALSEDISATLRCLTALGAGAERTDTGFIISPITKPSSRPVLDCRESGSTLRFMLPVAAALGAPAVFLGSGRLPDRPISEMTHALSARGVTFSSQRLPFEISGKLMAGACEVAGDVSSQYITGLLLALASLSGDSELKLTSPLKSAPYVDITLAVQRRFGAEITAHGGGYTIKGGGGYRSPHIIKAGGDWSNAAFFLAAGALGGPVTVQGLDMSSRQGDKAIAAILEKLGAHVSIQPQGVTVCAGELRGCTVDISETPDLLPVLAVISCFCKGETRFINAGRLRLKESDRLEEAVKLITGLGGSARADKDSMTVQGTGLSGGCADSAGDHRIAMAAAVAAVACRSDVTLSGAQAVNKSYPAFFEDYNKLGGEANVI